MARGGDTFLGCISDGEDGDEIVVCHLREELFHLGRVKVTDPCRAQSLVVNGEHDVGRDDGGIHIGEIASVVLTHPCVFVLSADHEEDACTEGVVRRLRQFCPRLGALDRPDLERLLVDRRGRNTRRLKNAVKRLAWDLSVRQGAAGEPILNEFIEFHMITSLREPLKV